MPTTQVVSLIEMWTEWTESFLTTGCLGWTASTTQKPSAMLCGVLSERFSMRVFYPGRCPGLVYGVPLALREAGEAIECSYPCLRHIVAYVSKQ